MYKIFFPVEKCFVFWREKQSAISETYGTNMHMRVTHRFEIAVAVSNVRCVYHPEGTKCLIIGINRTVTEAYESHRLLEDLRRQNGMVKHGIFIYLHPSYSSIRNYQQYRFAKNKLIFNFFAHISCTNDRNNFLLLNTNSALNAFPINLECKMYVLGLFQRKSCSASLPKNH